MSESENKNCDNCGNNRKTDYCQICKLGFIDKMMLEGACKRWTPTKGAN